MMKKTFFLVLAIAMGFTACEDDDLQDKDIPSVVLNGFLEQFPNATGVEWEKREDLYEAEFHNDSVEHEAIINAEGSILKYKYGLPYEELPEAIKTSITSNFDSTKVDDVEVLQISGDTYYQVEFEEDRNENYVIFNEAGQVTSDIAVW